MTWTCYIAGFREKGACTYLNGDRSCGCLRLTGICEDGQRHNGYRQRVGRTWHRKLPYYRRIFPVRMLKLRLAANSYQTCYLPRPFSSTAILLNCTDQPGTPDRVGMSELALLGLSRSVTFWIKDCLRCDGVGAFKSNLLADLSNCDDCSYFVAHRVRRHPARAACCSWQASSMRTRYWQPNVRHA